MNSFKHDLFSVPVMYYENFLPLELAHTIKDYILNKADTATPHSIISGSGISNHLNNGIYFIQEITSSVEGCSQLYNNIVACVDEYTVRAGIPKNRISNSWFNIQQPGSILKRHNHTGSNTLVSGALYINVDKESSPIVFDNPNPYSFLSDYNIGNTYKYRSFKPNIGDLILFPSWLIHSSGETNKTKDRIVISLNAGIYE